MRRVRRSVSTSPGRCGLRSRSCSPPMRPGSPGSGSDGAALAPESVEALFNQAKALDRLRGWAEALPLLRRARTLAPENEEIWAALRGHLLLFQRHDEAFEDFRAFEPYARLSAPVVIAGLISAHVAPGTQYEDKYVPLAVNWPYG